LQPSRHSQCEADHVAGRYPDLRCQYRVQEAGIDARKPLLSNDFPLTETTFFCL
jgi:hypothetical protein